MFETSCFHEDLYAMRQIYNAGGLGKLIYAEGEYYHYMEQPIDSYKGWRIGLPPQCYPTHSNAYYTGVTGGSFTEVSCMGIPSSIEHLKPANNRLQESLRHGDRDCSARAKAARRAWPSVGTRPAAVARWAASAGRRARSTENTKGWRKVSPEHKTSGAAAAVDPGSHGGSHGYLTQRIRLRDPARPQAAGGHRHGAEHDGARNRRAPIRDERRRVAEDSAVQNLTVTVFVIESCRSGLPLFVTQERVQSELYSCCTARGAGPGRGVA